VKVVKTKYGEVAPALDYTGYTRTWHPGFEDSLIWELISLKELWGVMIQVSRNRSKK
jgi:hypothetical protein